MNEWLHEWMNGPVDEYPGGVVDVEDEGGECGRQEGGGGHLGGQEAHS